MATIDSPQPIKSNALGVPSGVTVIRPWRVPTSFSWVVSINSEIALEFTYWSGMISISGRVNRLVSSNRFMISDRSVSCWSRPRRITASSSGSISICTPSNWGNGSIEGGSFLGFSSWPRAGFAAVALLGGCKAGGCAAPEGPLPVRSSA